MGEITVESLLNVRFDGVKINNLRVLARKTVQVKPYEAEVFEAETGITIEENITGMERALIEEIVHISLEFSIYSQLLARKSITMDEFMQRKQEMLKSALTLTNKLRQINPDSKVLATVLGEVQEN